jgi:hypothetical protein
MLCAIKGDFLKMTILIDGYISFEMYQTLQ